MNAPPAVHVRSVFSPCARYRYFLQRIWNPDLPIWCFVGANPSKAGSVGPDGRELSDPTVSGQVNRARDQGYGGLWVVNARAWISTDPSKVPGDPEAIGPENDLWIERCASLADLVVLGYGQLAGSPRAGDVQRIIRKAGAMPHALALTREGLPHHPRGVPRNAKPFPLPWQRADGA